jgi:hypothetical protein
MMKRLVGTYYLEEGCHLDTAKTIGPVHQTDKNRGAKPRAGSKKNPPHDVE